MDTVLRVSHIILILKDVKGYKMKKKTYENNLQNVTNTWEENYHHSGCNKTFSIGTNLIIKKHFITKTNSYQLKINTFLQGLGLPYECGRIVDTNGSCFNLRLLRGTVSITRGTDGRTW